MQNRIKCIMYVCLCNYNLKILQNSLSELHKASGNTLSDHTNVIYKHVHHVHLHAQIELTVLCLYLLVRQL